MINEMLLKKLPYYEHLTNDEMTLISTHWHKKTYKKGELIHGGMNKCLGQIMILSGTVRIYMLSEEGREITLFTLNPCESCVLSASCVISQITFEIQMIAETDVEMMVLGAGVMSSLTEHNIYVKCYVYEYLTKRFSTVMWVMQEILFKSFDRRLATFLISKYEKTGSKEINMNHQQIAQYTNSAREVVARMLKRFSYEGYLEYKRGVITLKDIDALKDLI